MSPKQRRRGWGALVFFLVLILGLGYLWADADDRVPGYLTWAPPPGPAEPFPTPPGAVEPVQSAPAPTGATAEQALPDKDFQQLVDDLVDDTDNLGKSVSVIISDAVTGERLAAHRPNRAMTPASTQKSLVALAAAEQLDLSATLRTTVVQSGAGRITLVGGGDMMLAAEHGDDSAVNGRAGLADLADATASSLTLRGDTTVALDFDTSAFDPNAYGVWGNYTPADGYAAPVVALAVDTGRRSEGAYAPRFNDPAREAAEQFAARLTEAGITVTGEPRQQKATTGARELAAVDSAPLRDIVQYFMATSDNTITEVVGRLVAIDRGLPASFDGSTKAVLAVLAGIGVDVSGAKMVDCSGLAKGSKIPTRVIHETIRHLYTPGDGTFHDAATGMPISGLTGTLADRMTSESARGNVRAKTGSLPKVVALAGVVQTATQRPLSFVVITDRSPNTWSSRKVIDDFITGLTK